MVQVDVQQARDQLTDLLVRCEQGEQGEQGEQIVITRAGRPVARLEPLSVQPQRHFGVVELDVPDDFDEPLPAQELAAWG